VTINKPNKVLFYQLLAPSPTNGGVQRVTYLLAGKLRTLGYSCYCIHVKGDKLVSEEPVFEDISCINYLAANACLELIDYVKKHKISIIINQCAYTPRILKLFEVVKKSTNVKLITCMHNTPLLLAPHSHGHSFLQKLSLTQNIKRMRITNHYNRISKSSDKFVLLSPSFISTLKNTFRIQNTTKICAIPNPLSFNTFATEDDIAKKEKIVLIVARFIENQKRILLALKIWKYIESFGYQGWKLVIVGYGTSENLYEEYINQNHVENVELVGKKDPYPYFKTASIFMMTSAYEGWGMTLTEAQQMGVVPIAFDSYSALHDIITDNQNGLIIENNSTYQFGDKLYELMMDTEGRRKIAVAAVASSYRFELSKIIEKWIRLFEEKDKQ